MVSRNQHHGGEGPSGPRAARVEAPAVADTADRALRDLVHELAGLIDGAGRYLRLAGAELCADDPTPESLSTLIGAAHLAIDQAATVLRDALDSPIPDRRFDASPGASLADVIEHAAIVLRPLASERGVEVRSRLGDGLEHTPPLPLYSVLANGLRNAIEASPSGSDVELVALIDEDGPRPVLVVEILDVGPGPPEQITRVFEPAFTTKAHGSGLGLAIARDVVRSLDGAIALEPRPAARGARLSIRIPLDRAGRTTPDPASPRP